MVWYGAEDAFASSKEALSEARTRLVTQHKVTRSMTEAARWKRFAPSNDAGLLVVVHGGYVIRLWRRPFRDARFAPECGAENSIVRTKSIVLHMAIKAVLSSRRS